MPGPRLIREVDRRWFAPLPARRLAVFRILVGGYAVIWSLVRLPAHLAHAGRTGWDPVGVLAPFTEPLPDGAVVALAVGTPLLGLLFVAGRWFAVAGPAFALALLAVTTLDSSWGTILHTENLMVLHVGILAATPAAGHALTFPRRAGDPPPDHGRYGWPLRLAMVVVVVAYVLAGLAKLKGEGWGWAGGDVLRNLVAHDNLRKWALGDLYSPLGTAAVRYAWVFPLFATGSLAVELGAWLALSRGRLRTVWVAAAWVFHLGVLALMGVLFPYQLTGIAFAPFLLAGGGMRSLPGGSRPGRSCPRLTEQAP